MNDYFGTALPQSSDWLQSHCRVQAEPVRDSGDHPLGDRYRVFDVVEGGMGAVYFCFDREFQRPFAAKTFLAAVGQPAAVGQIKREAALWVSLGHHGHIVRCHYVLEIAGRPFVFADWVRAAPGKPVSLRGRMSDYTGRSDASLRLLYQASQGVAFAHRNGVVHQDLKPGNVLVGASGDPYVTDFGLAAALHGEGRERAAAARGGTPLYMAPEQWRGSAVGPATDVYALGAMLHELLTGRPPFMVDPTLEKRTYLDECQRLHCEASPAALGQLPGEVQDLVARCLSKDPESRPADADSLAQELGALLQNRGHALPSTRSAEGGGMGPIHYSNRATVHYWIGEYELARDDAAAAIELDPSFGAAHSNRGLALERLGQLEEALRDHERAVEVEPENDQSWANLGLVLGTLGRHDEERAALQRAAELAPENLLHTDNLALALSPGERAVRLADERIERSPEDWRGYRTRAAILLRAGSLDRALADADRALELAPVEPTLHVLRGELFQRVGRTDEAERSFIKALELDPTADYALETLTHHFQSTGQHQAALDLADRIARLTPGRPLPLFIRGVALAHLGALEGGLRDLLACSELGSPLRGTALSRAVRLQVELGRFSEALESAEACLSAPRLTVADRVGALLYEGLAHERLGDVEAALTSYERGLEADPQKYILHSNVGSVLLGRGDPQGALSSFLRALEIHPEHRETLFNAGIAHQWMGDLTAARRYFTAASELGYTDATEQLQFLRGVEMVMDIWLAQNNQEELLEMIDWKPALAAPKIVEVVAAVARRGGPTGELLQERLSWLPRT